MWVAPGMWASSNCSAVRVSTRNAPSATRRSSCPGVIGCASTPSVSSSPRLIATMLAKFGGCGADPGERLLDELVLALDAEQLVVGELVAERRGDLRAHRAAAAHRAAEVAGPDLGLRRQAEQLLVQRLVDPAGAVAPCRSRGRAGRRRRRTACRRSAPPRACRSATRSVSANAVCSGRWPGVWSAVDRHVAELEAPSRRRRARARSRARRAGGRGSSRRSPRPAGRGRRRGRRGCGSRGCARSAPRGSGRSRGTRRSRTSGRRRRRRRRRRPCTRRRRGPPAGTGGRSRASPFSRALDQCPNLTLGRNRSSRFGTAQAAGRRAGAVPAAAAAAPAARRAAPRRRGSRPSPWAAAARRGRR